MISVKADKDIEPKENDIKDSVVQTLTPSVTIGIPVLNEEEHIERVIFGFLNSKYPNLEEILIADGGSEDRTREIVNELSKKDARVKLVDNPEKFQSFGLNRMIEVAKGEIFLRADGHCFYSVDYIEKCVEVMLRTGARNVGGSQRYMAENRVQAGIALAVKSFLGNGGAKYMNEQFQGYADTVFLGCFKTKDLRTVGGFNTENVTNQDSELNLRLIEKYGETVFLSPEIKSWYFPRESFSKLFKQYFRYGRGRFLTKMLHPKSSPIRGLIPFIFLLALSIFVLTDFIISINLYSTAILGLLAIIVLVESFRITLAKKGLFEIEIWNGKDKKPGFFSNLFTSMISLIVMQIGHFLGFLYQLVRKLIIGKKGW